MPIKINSYGGIITWCMRKKISAYISKIALEFTSKRYENVIKSYIQKFNNTDEIPLFKMVNIETINRCNGKCSFCPANIRDEQRELKRMSDYIFEKIIMGLIFILDYRLYINNNNNNNKNHHLQSQLHMVL